MRKLLNWLDRHFLEAGVCLLLFFIPLYPKLPLIDIPHTWVYIRVEDFLVSLVVGVWLIQLARRKLTLKIPLFFPILFYWLSGGLSLVYAVFILGKHLANFFPHLAILHFVRRVEYMVLFFVAASTIKDLRVVKKYLFVVALSLLGVCLYGFGQKFLSFPAFLTMNEEFAKGLPLYLPPGARITATFAGHYDLAAWLVLMIAVFGALVFGLKRRVLKISVFFLTFAGFVLLLLTASRVSFACYLVSISLMLYLQKQKKFIIPVALASLFLMNYVTGAARFGKTLRVEDVVYEAGTGKPIAVMESPEEIGKVFTEEEEVAREELPVGSGFLEIPALQRTPPEATQVAIIKKPLKEAKLVSEIATVSGEFLIKRTIVYDVSFTTRFQGTWPRAMKAFQKNPLLGTGYSSIGLATDNSYLRALGETGLLGLFAFLSVLFSLGLLAKQGLARLKDPFAHSLLIGATAGTFGIVLNGLLIDVFEASKVAFSLWIILGIVAGVVSFLVPRRKSLVKEAIEVLRWSLTLIGILAIVSIFPFYSGLKHYFAGDDFTWLRWAATSKIADIPQFFLQAEGFFYRPLAKAYFVLIQSFLGLKPQGYHFVDFLLHFGCVAGVYLLALLLTKKRLVAFLTALFFLIHPINSESVFWISSASALFASFFYIWGFLSYLRWREGREKWKGVFLVLSVFAFSLSLTSHERVVTFPLVIFFYDLVFGKLKEKKSWLFKIAPYLPFWFLLASYLCLRNIAQAHGLSGDYSYNFRNLIFNFAGNFFGYLGELIASFHFIPFYDASRTFLRLHKLSAFGLLAGLIVVVAGIVRKIKIDRLTFFSLGFLFILLLPFLGLGNIAERHVYPAHFGFFLILSLLIVKLFEKLKKRNSVLGLTILALLVGTITGFYFLEMQKAKKDWYQAGETANKILLALSTNYKKFPQGSTLHFVNLPIRQNRAWIFPVGLEDGIWFIYRADDLAVKKDLDLEKALEASAAETNSFVFLFEENQLKEVTR